MLSIQGGGIYIDGSADLTDCNIHDNVATDVSPLLKLNPHSVVSLVQYPLELALELTGCCARAHECGVAVCECLHFEPPRHFLHRPIEIP